MPSDTFGNVEATVARVLRIGSLAVLAVLALATLTVVPAIQSRLDDAVNVLTSVLAVTGIAAAVLALSMVVLWVLRRETGTAVLPFEVASGMNLVGTALSDLLVATLQRVCEVHQQGPPPAMQHVEVQTERLLMPTIAPSQEDMTGALAELGTISAGAAELSLGKLLVALKLLRRDPKAVIIRGSVQGDAERVDVAVRVETRGRARAFAAAGTTSDANHISGLIGDVAYQLVAEGEFLQKLSAHSWQGLKFFTEALDAYAHFTRSGCIADLHAARQNCEKAVGVERRYQKVFAVAYNIGIAYLHEGDADNALLAFNAARQSDPGNPAALIGLGVTHHRMGNYVTAIDLFNEALTIASADDLWVRASVLAGLGNAWSDRGYLEKGIDYFQQAADLSASAGNQLGEAENLSRLARRYSDQGRVTEALRMARTAVELLPSTTDPYTRGRLLENLAAVLADDGQYAEAQGVAREAIAAAADVPSAFLRAGASLTLARTLLLTGMFEDAKVAAEAAEIQRSGFRHTAVAFLGIAALRLNQLALAQEMFTKAIREADVMIANDEHNFGALYAKALSLDGLASVVQKRSRRRRGAAKLKADAAAVRQRATDINPSAGVVARQARLVEALE